MRHTPRTTRSTRTAAGAHLLLALASFLPQLLSRPGALPADTKTYLFLDPGRFLGQSLSAWDPTVGLGTVTHLQIGYLFPMGPYFLATHALHVPAWVAQRLWVGAILFAAGAGVLALCRCLGVGGPGALVASLAYLLTPYTLQYIGHSSVVLLAYAGLPWLVVLVERSTARGGWRAPAAAALVVTAIASVVASSAVYVLVAPALWLAWSGLTGRHRWPAVWRTAWRCGLLAALVSLWWLAALAVEGGYGIDVLRYTETVQAVSSASLSSEVLRGLGYWYFYGGDNFGPWVSAMPQFTEQVWLVGASYLVPVLAVGSAVLLRWRHRAAFVALVVVGMVLAVGANPLTSPSPVGRLLDGLFTTSTVGLALRSTDRATPLVVLGLAMLLGAGVTALWHRAPRRGMVLAALAVGAAVASNPALWNGTSVPTTFVAGTVPGYDHQAARALDRTGAAGAVLAVPGQPFASTFAGTTVDPVWPALLTRPFVTREQQVQGSLPTEDFLYALDDPVQNGVEDPAALAAMARLAGAGDLLVQNDLAFTRYDQPDPAVLWSALTAGPVPGLGRVVGFGPARPAVGRTKVLDEQAFTLPRTLALMPPVAVVPVAAPRPLVRAEAATGGVVVAGDAVGLDDLAGTGLLSGAPAVTYAGTLDTDPAARRRALGPGATLVVTDANRRQSFRWDTLTDVAGATLQAGQAYPGGPQDLPLDLFPGAPGAQTTTALSGVASVSASGSGNLFQSRPEDRPVEAVDGDLSTAWQVGPFLDPRGQWWQVDLRAPRQVDRVTLVQPQSARHDQWITAVTLRFDGGSPLHVRLGPASRRPGGQVVSFPARMLRRLRVTVDDTNVSPLRAREGGVSAVGLAEVGIADVQARETVVMPRNLLAAAGRASAADRLAFVMTRLRVAPATSRADPEAALDRTLWLPAARTFRLTGTARVDTAAPDGLVDQLLGRPTSPPAVAASSTGRLAGEVTDTAAAALDGDPATAWSSPIGGAGAVRQSITARLPAPVAFDHLDLQVVVDGRHSVPSRLRISTESGSAVVAVPKLPRQETGGVDRAVVRFPTLRGRTVTVSILGVRPLRAADYYGGGEQHLPVAIAELGIPGVRVPPLPAAMPAPCRDDLLRVDGRPVWTEIGGRRATATTTGLPLSLCGPDAGGMALSAGVHDVVATRGTSSGLDLDQLVLDSAVGGGPEAADRPGALVAAPTPPAPAVRVLHHGTTTVQLQVEASKTGTGPFWLVLGESVNAGWRAQVAGGRSLGSPTLVDGFANGWLVPAGTLAPGRWTTITLHWTPQRAVDGALLVSAAAGLLCLVLLLLPHRRRRGGAEVTGGVAPPALLAGWPGDEDRRDADRRDGPGGRRAALAALAAGGLTAVVFDPLAGAGVGVVVAGACLWHRGRALVAAGAVGLVLAAALAVTVGEGVGGYFGNGDWPSHFTAAAALTWSALGLLAGEAAIRAARRGRAGRRAHPGAPRASPPPSPPS